LAIVKDLRINVTHRLSDEFKIDIYHGPGQDLNDKINDEREMLIHKELLNLKIIKFKKVIKDTKYFEYEWILNDEEYFCTWSDYDPKYPKLR
jgi:hypothetical protein